jgi:hypothetical protein
MRAFLSAAPNTYYCAESGKRSFGTRSTETSCDDHSRSRLAGGLARRFWHRQTPGNPAAGKPAGQMTLGRNPAQ